MIVLFNMKEYDKVLEISYSLQKNKLSRKSAANYNFIIGHINFLRKSYANACVMLKRCERYYIERNFTYDLAVLYNDLFVITKDEEYRLKFELYMSSAGGKNILLNIPDMSHEVCNVL